MVISFSPNNGPVSTRLLSASNVASRPLPSAPGFVAAKSPAFGAAKAAPVEDNSWGSWIKAGASSLAKLAIIEALLPFAIPLIAGMAIGFPLMARVAGCAFETIGKNAAGKYVGKLTNAAFVAKRFGKPVNILFQLPFRLVPAFVRKAAFIDRALGWLSRRSRSMSNLVRKGLHMMLRNETLKDYAYVPPYIIPKIKHFVGKFIDAFGFVLKNRFLGKSRIGRLLLGAGFLEVVKDPKTIAKEVLQTGKSNPVTDKAASPAAKPAEITPTPAAAKPEADSKPATPPPEYKTITKFA